ncbi:MAG: GHMP kinase, partial [Pseudomonadota bacterium]
MSTNASMTALIPEIGRAPGKVILCGEHAAVYGVPALSMAVDHYTDVWFTPSHRSSGLRTAFENLSQGQLYPLDLLKSFKQSLDRRFEQFSRGELTVQKILQRPDDLAVYTLMLLLNHLPVPGVSNTRRLPVPGKLSSRSALPLGAGMGSSAAVIAATFVLYEHLFNHAQSQVERFERVRFCERLQHGNGSAVDAAAVVYGGLNRIEGGALTQLTLADDHGLRRGEHWYWVLHGSPESSTGECVAQVRDTHGDDHALWQAFEACS